MICTDIGFGSNPSTLLVFQDSIIRENVCSLNPKQRQDFEVIHKWSRDYVKNLSSKVMKKVKPFHIFLTGAGGVGKSRLNKTIYISINNVLMYKGFNMAELTGVMSQEGDYNCISFLNKIRIGVVDNEVERSLLSRFVAIDSPLYPIHAVHMFPENCPAVDYNDLMLNEMEGQTISINATDKKPTEVQLSDKKIDAIRVRSIGNSGNLVSILKVKIGAQVMLTSNINIENRLVNGLVGNVMGIAHKHGAVKIIHVKFNDENAGLVTM